MTCYVLLLGGKGAFGPPASLWGWDVAIGPVHFPVWGLSDSEKCRRGAEALYELETGFREDGWPSEEFVYDEKHDLYRFPDGEFAFSREYANEPGMWEEGMIG